jgi:hypothetical protein
MLALSGTYRQSTKKDPNFCRSCFGTVIARPIPIPVLETARVRHFISEEEFIDMFASKKAITTCNNEAWVTII